MPVDADLALQQWRAYVGVFRRTGWTVTEVSPADEHVDGVFVEDTVVVIGTERRSSTSAAAPS